MPGGAGIIAQGRRSAKQILQGSHVAQKTEGHHPGNCAKADKVLQQNPKHKEAAGTLD